MDTVDICDGWLHLYFIAEPDAKDEPFQYHHCTLKVRFTDSQLNCLALILFQNTLIYGR
jgi:hypothetical protein